MSGVSTAHEKLKAASAALDECRASIDDAMDEHGPTDALTGIWDELVAASQKVTEIADALVLLETH